jgi:hypothetical protein
MAPEERKERTDMSLGVNPKCCPRMAAECRKCDVSNEAVMRCQVFM